MFKIGDFSKLGRISIKMLRHYDELGLLEPCHVDEATGYRYYSAGQIPRLNRILALKEIGFSLLEIGEVLEKDLSVKDMEGLLEFKKDSIMKVVKLEQDKISRIDAYVKILNQEAYGMKYDIVLKEIPPLKVVALRDIIPQYDEEGRLWTELSEYVKSEKIKTLAPSYAIYHDKGYKEKDVDVEVVHTVSEFGVDSDRVKYRMLEPVKHMACVIHKGPFNTLNIACNAVTVWMEENHYEMAGPMRAIYIKGIWNEPNPDEWMTEIQLPVKKNL